MYDTIDYAKINPNAVDTLKYVDNALKNAGYGYFQRLAILGTIQRESSGNPLAVSDNGLWHGLIQWDEDRYRIASDDPQVELKNQTDLLLKELEKTGWSGWTWKDQLAYSNSFKNADSLESAIDIITRRFVRPGDINGEIQKRLDIAKLGLIYNQAAKTKLRTLPDNLTHREKTEIRNNARRTNLDDYFINADNTRFPIEKVHVYKPTEFKLNVSETPVQSDNTNIQKPKGSISYKSKDVDLGNMSELANLLVEEGVNFEVTSGLRPGAITSFGKVSHHSTGNAMDITPGDGNWNRLLSELRNAPKSLAYMKEHGYGILDERSPEILARTGGTGAHWHVGPDKAAIAGLDKLLG